MTSGAPDPPDPPDPPANSPDPTSISVAEAKRRFADVLGAVRYRGERFIVERNGTPMAALVPLSDLQPRVESRATGFLALVGAFDDAPEFADAVARAAEDRVGQESRPPPRLDS